MDEYITKNNAISAACFGCNQEFSDEPCEPDACAIRQSIKNTPTADVVPTVSKMEQVRSEVAIEIFAEIEELLFSAFTAVMPCNSRLVNLNELAELKKKYTEEKSNVIEKAE